MPWVVLSVFVTAWGIGTRQGVPQCRAGRRGVYRATGSAPAPHPVLSPAFEVPALHQMVFRDFPVVTTPVDPARLREPAYKAQHGEAARFTFNWLSATGTAILLAALVTALFLRIPPGVVLPDGRPDAVAHALAAAHHRLHAGARVRDTLQRHRRHARPGLHAAPACSIRSSPPLLGWLGVALTGSDTCSNALFGSLQKITAQQLGLNPVLITAANSTGGVMGKMIDAQSIVVATAATNQPGQEGQILRFVFWHSIALVAIMGIIVMLQAYVFPWMVPVWP